MAKKTVGLGRDVRAVLRARRGSGRVLLEVEARGSHGTWVPGLSHHVDAHDAVDLGEALVAVARVAFRGAVGTEEGRDG